MKAVEKRASRVYSENSMNTREVLYMLTPVLVGLVVSVIFLFLYLDVAAEIDSLILLLALGLPPGLGILVMFFAALQLNSQAAYYGVRGVSRNLLSTTILFLDMLLEGHVETGQIVEPQPPEEFMCLSSIGLHATNFALRKLDPENYKIHAQLLSEKKQSGRSPRERLLMKYMILILLLMAGLTMTMMVLMVFSLFSEFLIVEVLTLFATLGLLLICMLGVQLRRNEQREPSEEVERAILEPDLATETRLILDRVLEIVLSEGEHPLRLLTIGEYDELTYTGNTYKTSRGIMLREAVLFPRHFNA